LSQRASVLHIFAALRPHRGNDYVTKPFAIDEPALRLMAGGDLDACPFIGPRGGRITTATLRDATSCDDVVTELGYRQLKRHSLRHTGLTWMADAGVPVHVLRKITGHADLSTTQRCLHPNRQSVAGFWLARR
jgi:integrase